MASTKFSEITKNIMIKQKNVRKKRPFKPVLIPLPNSEKYPKTSHSSKTSIKSFKKKIRRV